MAAHAATNAADTSVTETACAVLGFLSMAREATILGKMRSPCAAHLEQFRDKTEQLPRGTCVQLSAIEKKKILDYFRDGNRQSGFDPFDFCPARDLSRTANRPRDD